MDKMYRECVFISDCKKRNRGQMSPCAKDVEAVDNSAQQLKAEIAALADEILVMTPKQFELNDTYIYNRLRQLSAV